MENRREDVEELAIQGARAGEVMELKEWNCVEVKHHRDIGKTIVEYQGKGWRLHTYQTAGMGAKPMSYTVGHYLLFVRGAR